MSDGVSRRGKVFHMHSAEYKDLLQTIPQHKGVIGQAHLLIGTLPTINNTVTIGTEVWTFVASAASTYQVTRGATNLTAIAALVAKINANTALNILASATATGVKIQFAQTPGGTVKIGTPTSYALSQTLTDAADVWDQANLNATGQTNHLYSTVAQPVATAENIATPFTIPLKFTPTIINFRVVDVNGLPKPTCTATAAISGNGILVTFGAVGDPAVATDKMFIQAYGSALV